MTQALPRQRITLSAGALTDLDRANILAGIVKGAAQSTLMQNPAIAASVDALTKKGAALVNDSNLAAAAEQQLKATATQRDSSRGAFDMELLSLKGLVENNATKPSDVTDMGFSLFQSAKASRTPPDPPAALIVKIGKVHGKARVSVQGGRGSYVAEMTTDPAAAGPWTSLTGSGKERKLSGYASGTKIWVRFAAVRYGLQSAWSTPVLVTIP
jgi:hypothetical protein